MKTIRILMALLVLPMAWLFAASACYCLAIGHWEMFVWPFGQWIQAAPWWRLNDWMTIYVVGSAVPPTLFSLLLAYGAIRQAVIIRKRKKQEVFGKTGWANKAEMRDAGVHVGSKLFP